MRTFRAKLVKLSAFQCALILDLVLAHRRTAPGLTREERLAIDDLVERLTSLHESEGQ